MGVDLIEPPEIPFGCDYRRYDVLRLNADWIAHEGFDFICASPPCEQFSVHGMKHFHPNPPYPELGVKLFDHTRAICEASGLPYVIENVRAAQKFVGNAVHHCGPFYLWGNAVPPLMPQGLKKGIDWPRPVNGKRDYQRSYNWHSGKGQKRRDDTARVATIPPELSKCVADYAERLLGSRLVTK